MEKIYITPLWWYLEHCRQSKTDSKMQAELDTKTYYMPEERFLRHSSDQNWEGWIYWSFILLFQRREDGPVMENGWIDGPVYAVRDQCGFGHLRCAEGLI